MQSISKTWTASYVGLAIMAVSSITVQAQQNEPVPVNITASMSSKTFSVGEPILIHYSIHNSGEFFVHPELNDGKHQFLEGGHSKWFSISLKDAAGQNVPEAKFLPAPYEGAFVSSPGITPGGVYNGSIVANEWLNVLQSGHYTLSVMFHPYFPVDGEHYSSQAAVADAFTVPIVITPADPKSLQAKALLLRSEIMHCHDDVEQQVMLDTLFCLPQSAAGEEWNTLFFDKATSDRLRLMALKSVTRLQTPSAVDFLAQVYWGVDQGGSRLEDVNSAKAKTTAMLSLSDMYAHGDLALRKHVEDVFVAHGEQPPATPLLRLD